MKNEFIEWIEIDDAYIKTRHQVSKPSFFLVFLYGILVKQFTNVTVLKDSQLSSILRNGGKISAEREENSSFDHKR
jgi:hypothetical protein